MPSRIIENFKKEIGDDPVFSVRAAISPLFMIVSWQEGNKHPLDIVATTKNRETCFANNEKEYIAIAIDKFREYFFGEVTLRELIDEYEVFEKETQSVYDQVVSTDLIHLSEDELVALIAKVNKVFLDMVNVTLYIENVDYDKILSVIGAEYKEKLDAIWERATESTFMSFEGRLLKKTIEIVGNDQSNMVRQAKFIYTDYFWTKDEKSISEALNELRENFNEKKEEVIEMELAVKKREQEYMVWLERLDADSRKIANYAQLVMRMRDERKDPIAQIQAALAELSVIMLERAGVNESAAPYVLVYEYLEGVDYLARHKDFIEKRQHGCVYRANADRTYETELYDFEQASLELTALVEHKIEEADTLKGQTACKGRVEGMVRVIFDPHDDKGFQEGDILVTSMTRPEFVPIMKKARAVITNEGGITCHAAIISRELGVPCVIGTKIATQVLRDGDLVKVDADNGVIRIIERI